jgi:ABC-type multidrug transport system ATPase subunit/ABC-type multidrug transport system permease subunit
MVERSSLKSHPAEGDKRSSYRSLKLGHSGKTKDTRTPTSVVLDVIFQDLTVFGVATPSNTQETVLSVLEVALRRLTGTSIKPENRTILHNLQGRVRSGELLAVIGRPGSGCSTFLKTIAGELNGLVVDPKASISYGGITQSRFKRFFNGEANYSPELDIHFPHLTVQQTLNFAAALRAPHNRLAHQTREQYVKQVVGKAIDTYGLSHVVETQVGNDFIRGVSGGERKRVSIAEMVVSGCSVSCWDQSTRGLDSTTALNFVKSLREDARNGSCHIASLYQTSDAILLQFDRVLVLYEGRQIYYGSILRASKYFEDMGWLKPKNQPLGDFLAGLTNPEERQAREGYRDCVPRTAEEFEKAWVKSQRSSRLRQSLGWYNTDLNREGLLPDTERVLALKNSRAFTHTSSYLASQSTQIRYCVTRMAWRLWNDKKSTLIVTWGQTVMSLILGSLFYQTPNNTNGLYSKGGVLFASILLNIIVTIVEIFQLLGNKSIIERQSSYVLYRPWTEAFAGIILNIPLKLITASIFNIILYFLSGLHRTPESFFIFFLFVYTVTLVMSSVFRTIGAVATALPQAFALVGIVLPMFVVYTGFVVPKPYMHVWFKWLTYINPVGYAFESLIANEFHGRDFNCTAERIVPPYAEIANGSFVCAIRGSVPNQQFVSGDAYISANYNFFYSHIWRNLGILLAFLIFFIILCLIINERNAVLPVSTESLIFRKKRLQRSMENPNVKTQFSSSSSSNFLATEVSPELGLTHTKTLSWSYLCYDIQINKETKRLLNDISGWVKPGTLTALMVSSFKISSH